jgi:hypothetical protein
MILIVISRPMCSSAWVSPSKRDLRLGLVGRDVVADLHRPDRPTLVARPDGDLPGDRRVGRDDGVHLGDHLGVRVVAGETRREVGRRGARRGRGGDREEERQAEQAGAETSADGSGHGDRMPPRGKLGHPPNGHLRDEDERVGSGTGSR